MSTSFTRVRFYLLENVAKNFRTWETEHRWPEDGDEWVGQAAVCGVPYATWKASLVAKLIVPNISPGMHVLEIGPGHGRWTEFLAKYAAHLTIVDISPSCLDFCRDRFRSFETIDYFLTAGATFPEAASRQIDFVWSYDSFVHMDRDVIRAYLHEIHRVLKDGGSAIIHHSNVDDVEKHDQDASPGWRSAMNIALMRELAEEAALSVVSQFAYWDTEQRIGTPRFDDRITYLKREASA